MISITTKKIIVYIDQSFLSNLAKANDKNLEEYQRLSKLLQQGVADEKIICPTSWFHREESSLVNQKFEKDLKNQLGYLGQVDFKSEATIESEQFYIAAEKFCKLDVEISCKDIFDDDPDKHLELFKIDANLNFKVLDIPSQRALTKQNLDNVRREVLEKSQDFKTRLSIEQQGYKNHLSQNFGYIFSDIFQSKRERYLEFMRSQELYNMPKFHIYTTMWASILTGSSSREIQEGDWVDVEAISTFLPYTHLFTTDAFMKHHIIEHSLDKKYQTKVFCPRKNDILALCEELEKILRVAPPANVPVLTVILIPDEKMKEDYWNVCQKLNNSRNRWGEGWIELINVDDGKCPRFYHSGAKVELDAPSFMGFDHKADTKEEAVADAKSNRIILYDHYMQPNEDFIEHILNELEARRERPLGYELINRS